MIHHYASKKFIKADYSIPEKNNYCHPFNHGLRHYLLFFGLQGSVFPYFCIVRSAIFPMGYCCSAMDRKLSRMEGLQSTVRTGPFYCDKFSRSCPVIDLAVFTQKMFYTSRNHIFIIVCRYNSGKFIQLGLWANMAHGQSLPGCLESNSILVLVNLQNFYLLFSSCTNFYPNLFIAAYTVLLFPAVSPFFKKLNSPSSPEAA